MKVKVFTDKFRVNIKVQQVGETGIIWNELTDTWNSYTSPWDSWIAVGVNINIKAKAFLSKIKAKVI